MNPNQVRIPTVLGLLVLIIGITAGVWLVNSRQLIGVSADPTSQPSYVSVTNIADTGFTISWITNVPTTGTVSFGSNPDALTQSAIDDRDQESLKATPHKTHH